MAIIGPRVPWHPTTAGVVIPPTGNNNHLKSGITLGLFPSGFGYDVELWRSTQSSTGAGSSSKWALDANLTRGMNAEIVYQDVVLQSTKSYYYRARQNFPGFSPSAWTTVVSAKPVVIGTELSVNPPSFGSTALRQLRTVSTQDGTLTTGVLHGPSGVSRILTFPAGAFAPITSTGKWSFSVGGRLNITSTGTFTYMAPIPMPQGVKITQFAARIQFGGAGGGTSLNTVSVKLYKASTVTGIGATLVTLTTNGHTSGTRSLVSSAMSEVTANPTYTAVATHFINTASAQGQALIHVTLNYTRTQVQQAY